MIRPSTLVLVALIPFVACWAAPVAAQASPTPAVDTSRLDPAQKAFFEKVAAEEVCPCDCPRTFGQCLQEGSRCKPAVILAEWIVQELEQGTPPDALSEAISRELSGGFSAKQKKPELKGFAAKGANAPKITIVEYADFECTHCKAAVAVLDELVKKHPEVRVVFKHFPLSFHTHARHAAIATEAAARQGKFWEMQAAVFSTQEMLSDELILGHAKALGLDVQRFQKDLADPALAKKVDESRAEGLGYGIDATPAFLVEGRPYHLHRSVEGFEVRLRMEAARPGSTCQ